MSGVRRGRTTVSLDGAPPNRADLVQALRAAVTEQLTDEWAINIESARIVGLDDATGQVHIEAEFVAVPGTGPTDSTAPEGLVVYKNLPNKKFDHPSG